MKYDNRLEIRLSTAQKEQILQLAGSNSTISELIRQRLLKQPSRDELQSNKDIRNELKRIGNNLNQIARVLNSISLSQSPLSATDLIDFKANVQVAISSLKTLQNQF
ncbi:MAG: plasmid mobilization relaxosome protein MobC [Crocosphaera sp.]